jgi:signal transduction histidine kinase
MRAIRVEEIVPPAYRRSLLEHLARTKVEGRSRLETIFRTKAGEEFPVEIDATAQYDEAGALLRTRAFVRDLSETKRLERELVRWERLAAVGSMAAKVAHEIRNPLSAISLNAELLADEVSLLPDGSRTEGERLLTTILGEVDRLNAIIEEYLAFARLPRLQFQEVSLQECFYRLEQLLGQEMNHRGIRLSIARDESLPAVQGDVRQIEQVLLNLLRNSEDAMPDGGEIRVETKRIPGAVEVSITDDGLGIPEKSLPLIFDPFFTTKDTGTGLGLAYVQQVMHEHGGRIECESRVGEGTVFRITFPVEARSGDAERG